jgi:hypothetical protein
MDISHYVPQRSSLAKEHNDSHYIPRSVNVHKFTSVFKPRNVFPNMNISPEEHKKPRNECLFLY